MSPESLLLLLASLWTTTHGLMFASTNVTKQWDTWVFVENSTWYAYYLVTQVSYGEGFGVATSPNGVTNWTDHGFVWKAPSWYNPGTPTSPKQFWQGTSSVWRAADWETTGRYLINYSQMNTVCNCQNITFAESYDLIHWSNGLEKNETDEYPWFNIDSANYKVSGGRWDTIYSIPVSPTQVNVRDGYPRYGYWTASPLPASNGTFGFGITHDGTTWTALPSPEMLPAPIGGELGAVEYVRPNLYLAMIGYGWPRTMLTYTATSPKGPFTRATKNVDFLNGACYYSRFFRGPAEDGFELLVTHQTWDNHGTHFAYVSPFKIVDIDHEGTFRLKWWPKNEALKGATLPTDGTGTANVSQGLILEADFTMPSVDAKDPTQWPGFLLETIVPGYLWVGVDNTGIVGVGKYTSTSRRDDFNWTANAGTKPQVVPTHAKDATDWQYANGAASVASKLQGLTDIRSGGPGQTTLALVDHPLWSEGHLIIAVSLSFQYISGYGCVPSNTSSCDGASNLSLAIVDAINQSVVQILWDSPSLGNYSYGPFNGYSPPVSSGAVSHLAVGWPRQTQLALIFRNNKRNLQIPADTLNLTLTWGGKQTGAWNPSKAMAALKVSQTWNRDLAYKAGETLHARLLYRRSMVEMYVNDVLYPVYAMPDGTGQFGVTTNNVSAVKGLKAWRMALPASTNVGTKQVAHLASSRVPASLLLRV